LATYTIGDVQGCLARLEALLEQLGFDPACDRLRFAGDLVNRGPQSLEVLRFVRGLGDAAEAVLGNHDLHLLAAVHGARRPSRGDTLQSILGAPDRDALIDWLRHRPLLHESAGRGLVLVHAGLPPAWDLEAARGCARELEAVLASDRLPEFLSHMYGNEPRCWSDDLDGWERLRFITNAFTRLRYCDARGCLDFREKNPPGRQAAGLVPWFAVPERRSRGTPVVFGHWATLQLEVPLDPAHGVWHVDTGCVWGGALTALCEEDMTLHTVPGLDTTAARRHGAGRG
jgi:bis(5'-nucleosyl)-tetraphosphatase (symmetrical)